MDHRRSQHHVDDESFLASMAYTCLFTPTLQRLKHVHRENTEAVTALEDLGSSLHKADKTSPSFLFDFSKLLLDASRLDIDLQESYLRMQANASTEDLSIPHLSHKADYRDLCERAIALRRVLSRIPDEMADRRPFLETIKEIASSIKKLLDVTNAVIAQLPEHLQPGVEKRKREFVHYSKKFSSTLKDFFKTQNSTQVFVAANQLIFQTTQIVRVIRERVR